MSLNIWLCREVITWFNFLMQLRALISFLNLSQPSASSEHYNIQSTLRVSFLWTFKSDSDVLMKYWESVWCKNTDFVLNVFLILFFLFPVLPAQPQAVVIQNLQRRMSSGWRITSSSWKMTGQQWNWQCWSWKASTLIPLVMTLNLVETARG